MKQLLQGASATSAESSESDTAMPSVAPKQKQGLRGSNLQSKGANNADSDSSSGEDDDQDDPEKRYGLDKYDEDEGEFFTFFKTRVRVSVLILPQVKVYALEVWNFGIPGKS